MVAETQQKFSSNKIILSATLQKFLSSNKVKLLLNNAAIQFSIRYHFIGESSTFPRAINLRNSDFAKLMGNKNTFSKLVSILTELLRTVPWIFPFPIRISIRILQIFRKPSLFDKRTSLSFNTYQLF